MAEIAALASTVSLDEFLNDLQSCKQVIRDLREEVKALRAVLQSLHAVAEMANADLSYPIKNSPLLQSGKVCHGFEKAVRDAIAHTSQPMNFDDWGRVTYLGGSVSQFKNMLAVYRSTFVIIYFFAV
jgi:hypothetical protein